MHLWFVFFSRCSNWNFEIKYFIVITYFGLSHIRCRCETPIPHDRVQPDHEVHMLHPPCTAWGISWSLTHLPYMHHCGEEKRGIIIRNKTLLNC